MTAFLQRLAASATGVQPTVRPRLRSRFEPDAGASGDSDLVELHEESIRSAIEPPRTVAPPTADPLLRADTAGRVVTVPPPGSTEGREDPESAAPDADPLSERPRPLPDRASQAPPTRESPSSGDEPPPDTIERPARIASGEPSPSPPIRPRARETESAEAPVAAAPRPGPESPRREGVLRPPSVSVVLPSPPAPRHARRETDWPEPSPEPEIHVTIGRVEVRSVEPLPSAAPAPVLASPAATSGLTLADYLRERASGSRR